MVIRKYGDAFLDDTEAVVDPQLLLFEKVDYFISNYGGNLKVRPVIKCQHCKVNILPTNLVLTKNILLYLILPKASHHNEILMHL